MNSIARLGLIKSLVRLYSFARKTHYDVLALPRNCTNKEIKEAYIKLSKAYHPDKNKDPNAQNNFIVITEAYNVLNNRSSRALYDRTINYDYNNGHGYRQYDPYNWRNNPRYSYYYETSKAQGTRQQRASSQYGSTGFNKISNYVLIALCFCFALVGFVTQMLIIRQTFLIHRHKSNARSKRLGEELENVRRTADENGNVLQTRLMMRKIINDASPAVATAALGKELANEKNDRPI